MTDSEHTFGDWPIFGVDSQRDHPLYAHVFADTKTSMCRLPLRRMETLQESNLPTCETCAEIAKERSRVGVPIQKTDQESKP